jgi:hypothetical protein
MRLDCVLNASRMCIITETRPIHNTVNSSQVVEQVAAARIQLERAETT